jgi:hypothetical protein
MSVINHWIVGFIIVSKSAMMELAYCVMAAGFINVYVEGKSRRGEWCEREFRCENPCGKLLACRKHVSERLPFWG